MYNSNLFLSIRFDSIAISTARTQLKRKPVLRSFCVSVFFWAQLSMISDVDLGLCLSLNVQKEGKTKKEQMKRENETFYIGQ